MGHYPDDDVSAENVGQRQQTASVAAGVMLANTMPRAQGQDTLTELPMIQIEPRADLSVQRAMVLGDFGVGVNLRPGGLRIEGANAIDDRLLSLVGTVLNIGDMDAGSSRVSIYLSSDAQITVNDTLLRTIEVAGLAGGDLIDFQTEITLPAPLEEGQHYFLGLQVDSANQIAEADETDNISAAVLSSSASNAALGPGANIEPYVLVLREARDVQESGDLARFGTGWRLAEALSADDLALLSTDLVAAGVPAFTGVPVFQFQALPSLLDGSVDALVLYRNSTLIDPLPDGLVAFEIPRGPGALLPFDPGVELVVGTSGDDILLPSIQSDLIVGGEGRDRAVYDGAQHSYTLTLTPSCLTLVDRRAPEGHVDSLISVEELDFGSEIDIFAGQPMPVDIFTGPTQLRAEDFYRITELYIAYFNRAPDALGLYYWGGEFERGFTLLDIATNFFQQPETRATYASMLDGNGRLQDTDGFITAVYANVLGRAPDAPGFAYWVDELNNNPQITPANFILAIINGAKFSSTQTPQILLDQAYLETKAEIGAYYAVIKGMSVVSDASLMMSLYDGTTQSVVAAVALTDAMYDAALDPLEGDFLFPLVGVFDDPFAMM